MMDVELETNYVDLGTNNVDLETNAVELETNAADLEKKDIELEMKFLAVNNTTELKAIVAKEKIVMGPGRKNKTDYINAIYSARHVNNAFSCIMCACCAHFLIVVNICIYKYYDVFAFRCEYNIYVLLHAHSYIIIIYYQLKELRIQFT